MIKRILGSETFARSLIGVGLAVALMPIVIILLTILPFGITKSIGMAQIFLMLGIGGFIIILGLNQISKLKD